MLKELTKGDIPNFINGDITDANTALLFHIPGHCAGCARVINLLENRDTSNWTIYLVDVENEQNRNLVSAFDILTAPTIVYNLNGRQDKVAGLKNFLKRQEIFF